MCQSCRLVDRSFRPGVVSVIGLDRSRPCPNVSPDDTGRDTGGPFSDPAHVHSGKSLGRRELGSAAPPGRSQDVRRKAGTGKLGVDLAPDSIMTRAANQDFYKTLAVLYDQPDHVRLASQFAEHVAHHLADVGGEHVLDLGCGTGVLAEILADRGLRVTGVDLSDEMLVIARRRCRAQRSRIEFLQGDVLKDRFEGPYPVVSASGEIVNHLETERKVARYFANVFRHVQPGGVFVFDAIQRATFENNWDDRSYYLSGETGDIVQECSWDASRNVGTVEMTGYVKQARGAYRKVGITLEEYCHDAPFLKSALRAAGFMKVKQTAWCPWADGFADHDLWTAVRPSSG